MTVRDNPAIPLTVKAKRAAEPLSLNDEEIKLKIKSGQVNSTDLAQEIHDTRTHCYPQEQETKTKWQEKRGPIGPS